MPGQPVKLGPFVGGMNTYSGPTSLADNEAVELLNVDIDLDGSLASRPPVEIIPRGISDIGPSHVIGIFRASSGNLYIIYAHPTSVRAYNIATATWILIKDLITVTSCVQYNDTLYLVQKPSGTTQGGYKWTPSGGAVAIASMPRGYSSCIYKERMFISASRGGDENSINRVKFSNPANPDTWTSTDYFDVSAGDGQDITKLFTFDAGIVIFKSDSTFIFAYESAPTRGQVQQVSSRLGANNDYSVVEYENNLFVMHEANVYRISNWNWEHANIKVPFVFNNTSGTAVTEGSSISIIGNRLLCRYFDNYYVLGLKTGAWTTWAFASDRTPSEFVNNPEIDPALGVTEYWAGSYIGSGASNAAYKFKDYFSALSEPFDVRIKTKSYDFGPSYSFKRLFWWGVDLLSKNLISFKVSPVVYSTPVTWGQLRGVPISNLNTWGRPLDINIDVTDSISSSNPTGYRTFVKLLKSLRFRQLQFTLESTLDGTSNTGPLRVFSLTAFVDSKETVTKKVS